MPCYNQASFLPQAIASLQAQTLPDWECLIVDDGSTDDTPVVARQMMTQDPRVRLLQKENGGSASARDLGLEHAQGKYIQFLDADDALSPDKLQRQVEVMEQQDLEMSYTAFCQTFAAGLQQPTQVVRLNIFRLFVDWGLSSSVPIHAFMYRTAFLRRHALSFSSPCRVREDWRWHIRCFGAQPKQALLPDCCGAYYFQNEQGKTGSYIRIQEGNFRFMAYMSEQLTVVPALLWALRISEELWLWVLRMLKYRSTAVVSSIVLLWANPSAIILFIVAWWLLPLSFWFVLVYFIKTYLLK